MVSWFNDESAQAVVRGDLRTSDLICALQSCWKVLFEMARSASAIYEAAFDAAMGCNPRLQSQKSILRAGSEVS